MISATIECDMPGCGTREMIVLSVDYSSPPRRGRNDSDWYAARVGTPLGWELRRRIDGGAFAHYCPHHAGS